MVILPYGSFKPLCKTPFQCTRSSAVPIITPLESSISSPICQHLLHLESELLLSDPSQRPTTNSYSVFIVSTFLLRYQSTPFLPLFESPPSFVETNPLDSSTLDLNQRLRLVPITFRHRSPHHTFSFLLPVSIAAKNIFSLNQCPGLWLVFNSQPFHWLITWLESSVLSDIQ